jgi:hypothetical protein
MNVGGKEGQFLVLRVFTPTVFLCCFCFMWCCESPTTRRRMKGDKNRERRKKGERKKSEEQRLRTCTPPSCRVPFFVFLLHARVSVYVCVSVVAVGLLLVACCLLFFVFCLSALLTVDDGFVQRVERRMGEEGDVRFKLLASTLLLLTHLVQQEWP